MSGTGRPARPEPLVVATWNVSRCGGRDGRRDPERTARVIRHLDAQLVSLQEVDSEAARPGFVDQLRFLADLTGMEPVAGPALRRADGGYGNGVLSSLPILDVRRHDLSVPGREPRGALELTIRAPAGEMTLVNTHLGLRRTERRSQGERLGRILRRLASTRLLVAGDFNEWLPLGGVPRRLDRLLGPVRTPATFPSRWPLVRLDRFWVGASLHLRCLERIESEEARLASDHLPLRARLVPFREG